MKKILFFLTLLLASFVQIADAGLVPGTIRESGYRSGITCNSNASTYSDANGWCSQGSCKTYKSCATSACWVETYKSCATSACWVNTYKSCQNVACGSTTNSCQNAACGTTPTPAGCSWTGCTWSTNKTCQTAACGSTTNTCATSACWVNTYNTCVNSACWVNTYNTCVNSACWCKYYYNVAWENSSFSYWNYTLNTGSPKYSSASGDRKLGNDINASCSQTTNGTNNTPPTWYPSPWHNSSQTCYNDDSTYNSTAYWYNSNGSNGVCNTAIKTDNCIVSYDQVGSIQRSPSSGCNSTVWAGTTTWSPTATATCTVEWRYATPDDTGPTISVNGTSAVFDNDADNWCNMTKYTASDYGTTANPTLPGCTYYKGKISHANGSDKHPDLLENLTITVGGDPSGIDNIWVEIGSCVATYDFHAIVGTNNILSSSTLPQGIQTLFANPITIAYNSITSYGINPIGYNLSGLLTKLKKNWNWITRIDQCLSEGKNYLRITVTDGARSNADGVSWVGNTSILDYSGQGKFIKVDNSTAKIGLTGEAKKIAISNTPGNCFIGGATIDDTWKNYTISGNLKSWDPFGNDATDCSEKCAVLTGTGFTCTGGSKGVPPASALSGTPKSFTTASNMVWTAPTGVSPTTGTFMGYTCDGVGPIPNVESCEWDCKTGFSYDAVTQKCVQLSSLFILFDDGTANASGPYAAKLTDDPNTSHGLVKSKSVACTTPANATSSKKYFNFSFKADNTLAHFTPSDSKVYPIKENGSSLCTPTCNTNYTAVPGATGGSCTGNTQNASCALPTNIANTVWNTSDSIIQTWNGSWSPALPATTYNTTAGDCRYKCATGANWDGATSSCVVPVVPVVIPADPICTAGGVVQCIIGVTPPPASCNNNWMQDNSETWIDCGGGNCGACTVATGPTNSFSQVAVLYEENPTDSDGNLIGSGVTVIDEFVSKSTCNRSITVSTNSDGQINVRLPIYGYGDCGVCSPSCNYANRDLQLIPWVPQILSASYLDSGGDQLWNYPTVSYDGQKTISVSGVGTYYHPQWCNKSNMTDTSIKSCMSQPVYDSDTGELISPSIETDKCCRKKVGGRWNWVQCTPIYNCSSPGFIMSW